MERIVNMYYPYFRGKQNELMLIRESAEILSASNFIPIIEPVKESMSGLIRAMDALNDAGGKAILIMNPLCGDHKDNHSSIQEFLLEDLDKIDIDAGIILDENMTAEDAMQIHAVLCEHGKNATFIHSGFTEAKSLASHLGESLDKTRQIFIEDYCGKLYQKHFRGAELVLIRDGFHKRTNREHPEVEFFSDLHITYDLEGVNGFGDFLIVGNEYSETGGPAYAVAIHLSFINHEKDDEMHIHHFVSDRKNTPADPAGKFLEALEKLVENVSAEGTHIYKSSAVDEFIDLYKRQHYPGLGYVKKLSMKHHVETLANFFSEHE